jgi:SAM-dependent methyltransferase
MSAAIWHDLECGGYTADLGVWLELAGRQDGPVLDIGAGTGRTALPIARLGLPVTAIDRDDAVLRELRVRALSDGLGLTTHLADARSFELGVRFALLIVPMQTVQLLEGPDGRARLFDCARGHMGPDSRLAVAIVEELESFEVIDGFPGPLPDVAELDGIVYSSRPVAVREEPDAFVLERRRETVGPGGELSLERNLIRLDRVDAATLEAEGTAAGLRALERVPVPETDDYAGSTVVVFGG